MKRNVRTRMTEEDIRNSNKITVQRVIQLDDRVIRPITMKELREFKRLLDQAERDPDYEIQH